MICMRNVVKQYQTRHGEVTVLDHVNLIIRHGEKIGILGRNGSGKSTMIRLISGGEQPTSGSIERSMSVSWPLAFSGAFQGTLTGLDNLRFICRIYGVNANSRIEYVQDFSELGKYLYEPVKTYSSGMRARLAFAISMAVDFDCFLIDEIIAVGDSRFHERCQRELFEKRKEKAMIIVSHDIQNIREQCERFCVVHEGKLFQFFNIDIAYNFYKDNC
ncbi:MAG: ABC transporter ATP-binding protein [Chlorobiaceae bacterium]|nr:ABC transporter ATP-binding protein [Chlorobiaceae bacterium]